MWWHIILIPALRRQEQADLFEFEANLVYKAHPGQPGLLYTEILSREKKKKRFTFKVLTFQKNRRNSVLKLTFSIERNLALV